MIKLTVHYTNGTSEETQNSRRMNNFMQVRAEMDRIIANNHSGYRVPREMMAEIAMTRKSRICFFTEVSSVVKFVAEYEVTSVGVEKSTETVVNTIVGVDSQLNLVDE